MLCQRCGTENLDTAGFCMSCGQSLYGTGSASPGTAVACTFPGCGREVDLYTCDRCGKPFCQLHVDFDVLMPASGWGMVALMFKLPVNRDLYSVICKPCYSEVLNEKKRSQRIFTIISLILSLIICCCCSIGLIYLYNQIY